MTAGLIWTFIIITIIALHREQTPWSFSASLHTAQRARAVNQRTRDPGPVLAERELSLQGQGLWEQALTLGDLRSRLGSTHSCLQEAINPRAG